MEFRLVYQGPLKAAGRANTRSADKHTIRKQLHKQLKCLWEVVPELARRTQDHQTLSPGKSEWDANQKITRVTMATSFIQQSLVKTLGDDFDRCGYKFVPLVNERLNLSCGLEVIFLRRDMPGVPLIESGGDIDNRIKVLLDALRVPSNCNELPAGITKDPDEDPYFFCLLEDDKLITEIAVTTDNLLRTDVDESYVYLIIKVTVRPANFSFENLAFTI